MENVLAEQFDSLYSENQAKVYRLAYALVGNVSDAEDITQEAFFRAYRAFESFRRECSFFTWIYRIALNVANDYLKQRNKMPVQALTEDHGLSMESIIDDNPSTDPEMVLLNKEVKFKCLHCLTECLPTEQRKIFALAITIGLPHKMVAEILDCSISRVKTTLHRAKQRWFGYMENRCGLMKKNNPCHCEQWAKFGLAQGWLKIGEHSGQPLESDEKAIREIRQLRDLRDFYARTYENDMDEALAVRIREGITNKEWKIIS